MRNDIILNHERRFAKTEETFQEHLSKEKGCISYYKWKCKGERAFLESPKKIIFNIIYDAQTHITLFSEIIWVTRVL